MDLTFKDFNKICVEENEKKTKYNLEIAKGILRYSKIEGYRSPKRGTPEYKKGCGAVLAYLIDKNDFTNQNIANELLCSYDIVSAQTVQAWRNDRGKPDKIEAIKLCVLFDLDYYNSIEFLKLFGYSLFPGFEVEFEEGSTKSKSNNLNLKIKENTDYKILVLLSSYSRDKKESIKLISLYADDVI